MSKHRIQCILLNTISAQAEYVRKMRPGLWARRSTGRGTADMISDETAYRRYLDGEEQAAELLVERYGDALTLYVHGYIREIGRAHV